MRSRIGFGLAIASAALILIAPLRYAANAQGPETKPEAPPPEGDNQPVAAGPQARVSLLEGRLMVRGKDDQDYSYVERNAVLRVRDSLWTDEKSTAEVELERDSFLRLGEDTKVELRRLPPESDLRLWKGSIYVDLSDKLEQGILVKTPAGDIDVDPDSVVRIDIGKADSTTISVYEGRATAFPDRGDRVRVVKGRRLYLDPGEEAEFPRAIARGEEQDALDRFQVKREDYYAERPVPKELKEPLVGARELNDYGTWIEVENASYWRPSVGPDWYPYSSGSWGYINDCGWTWSGIEPWAYTTCHYGRWSYRPSFGWLWAPGYVWGPGWVRWGYCGDYISWAALDPFNRPCFVRSPFFRAGLFLDFGCWGSVHRRDWVSRSFRVRPLAAQRDANLNGFRAARQTDPALGPPTRIVRGLDTVQGAPRPASERARDLESRIRPIAFRENSLAERVRAGRQGRGGLTSEAGSVGARPDPFAREQALARQRAGGGVGSVSDGQSAVRGSRGEIGAPSDRDGRVRGGAPVPDRRGLGRDQPGGGGLLRPGPVAPGDDSRGRGRRREETAPSPPALDRGSRQRDGRGSVTSPPVVPEEDIDRRGRVRGVFDSDGRGRTGRSGESLRGGPGPEGSGASGGGSGRSSGRSYEGSDSSGRRGGRDRSGGFSGGGGNERSERGDRSSGSGRSGGVERSTGSGRSSDSHSGGSSRSEGSRGSGGSGYGGGGGYGSGGSPGRGGSGGGSYGGGGGGGDSRDRGSGSSGGGGGSGRRGR